MHRMHPSSLNDVGGAVAPRGIGALGVALRPPLELRGPPPLGEPQPLLGRQARLGRRGGRRGRGNRPDPQLAHRRGAGGGGRGNTAHLAMCDHFSL